MEFLGDGWVIEVGAGRPLILDNRARLWVEENMVLVGSFIGLQLILGDAMWLDAVPDALQAS